ncbi:zinc ribbon domain-containing protein [Streptomyces sp. NPDC016469]|uniref:zinc ribbon domain-containing protein n=1 Tax=Streptomyces sp. NPDC016469 TaxID=3157191 RepID=UPI0033DEFC30
MPSYCPFCGTQAPDDARFCMKCGRERPAAPAAPPQPAAPPPPAGAPAVEPPAVPAYMTRPAAPPPGYPPVPAGPSPAGIFFGRVMRGDWAGSLKAAVWPTGLIVGLAVVLAIPDYGQGDDVVVGWSDRLRIALAMLLQAFGGGFEVRAVVPGGGGYGGASPYGDSYGDFDPGAQSQTTLSLIPLTVTVLWIGALILGARGVRRQGGGLDAAVRISVVATAAVLVLGLYAQPEVEGYSLHSSPVLAALGALAIALVTTCAVLQRDVAAAWLAQRPGAQSFVRAAGTAVRALGAVLLLCGLIGYITYATLDDVNGTALLMALPLLPNIALMVLSVSWGGSVEYDARGQADIIGSGMDHGSFGLGELSDAANDWALVGALAAGLVSALIVGLLAGRRSADRREQVTAGGLFLLGFLALTAMSGLSAEFSGNVADIGGSGTLEVAPSVADALLFGLLWVGGAVLVAPYLARMTGGGGPGGGSPAYPAPPSPYGPPHPGPHIPGPYTPAPGKTAAPGPYVPKPGPQGPGPYPPPAQATAAEAAAPAPAPDTEPPTSTLPGPYVPAQAPAQPPAPRRRRAVLVWGATLAAALVLGGGATAGTLALMDRHDDDPGTSGNGRGKDGDRATPAQDRTSAAPSAEATATTDPAELVFPDGYSVVADTAGFSLALPDDWERQGEENHQVTYARSPGDTGLLKVGVIADAPYTSYENFKALEKTASAHQRNYQQVQLSANTFQGRPGARWEYTYEDRSGLPIHAIDQSYIAEDGTEYAIYVTERDVDWAGAREVFDTALSTWMLNDVD